MHKIDVQAFIIGLQEAALAASHGHRPRLKPWGLQLMKSQYYLKLTYIENTGAASPVGTTSRRLSLNSGAPCPTARVGLTRLQLSLQFYSSDKYSALNAHVLFKASLSSNRGKLHQS